MRTIEALSIEMVGGQLCLVFKADDNRHAGILGAISAKLLKEAAADFARLAELHAPAQVDRSSVVEARFPIRDFLEKR